MNKSPQKAIFIIALIGILSISMASAADTIYPIFFNYTMNSGINTGSVAQFSVNVNNTNGTVWLQLNNVNYSALNGTKLYNYNVSIAGLTNNTYTGFWGAYGNGSEVNNTNISSPSYTITYYIYAPAITTTQATTNNCNNLANGISNLASYVYVFLGILGVILVVGVIVLLTYVVKMEGEIDMNMGLLQLIGGGIMGIFLLLILSWAALVALKGIC